MKMRIHLAIVPVAFLAAPAFAQGLQVIYTEIAGHPSAAVPGALDAAGQPVAADFIALEDLALSHDGSQWMLKARTNQATTLDSILIRGSGTAGSAFAQDGQPFQGGVAGEQYDFFDSPIPAAWDSSGRIAFSARAKGGSASVFEKIVVYDPSTNTHTIVVQMGDAALGLVDLAPNPSGDETLGNSMNSVYLRDDGLVGFIDTPIQNCHSSRYPAFFLGHTSFRQSGVSPIGAEIWDSFGLSDAGGTPDALHWFAEGDTENPNTAIDGILAVDDQIVLQEGSPAAGSGPIVGSIVFTRMLSDGSWYSRGTTGSPTTNVWAVRNGTLLARDGDPVGPGENWALSFSGFTGNRNGHWLLTGTTTNPDPNRDTLLLLDGTTILAREGDAVDLDGDGQFNEDAFLGGFQPNDLFLSDEMVVYFLVTLRNGAGTLLGDAFLRLPITGNTTGTPICFGDGSGFGLTACPCANFGAPGHGCQNSASTGGSVLALTGSTAPDTLLLSASGELPSALSIFLQGTAVAAPGALFGDGVRCTGGTLKRLYTHNAVGGAVAAPSGADPAVSVRSAQLGDTIAPGTTRFYQVYYRDANAGFCAAPLGNTWNVSNGVRVPW